MLSIDNKTYKIIASLLFIFLIRAAIIFTYGPSVVPTGDDHPVYHSTAVRLSIDHKEWTRPGSEFGYRAPLYFIFLSTIYSTIGQPKYQIGQILSAILGTIICLILFLVVRNFYDEKTAWVSFWIRGLLPSFIISDTFVLSEPFFDIILLFAFLILSANTKTFNLLQCLGIGICMTLCVLTREAASFYPFIFLFILIINSNGILKTIRNIFGFSICFIIVVAPWLLRNELVWGKPFPLSYTAGVNLHIGNNYNATGAWILAPSEDIPKNIKFGTPEFNHWHMLKGEEFITENPIRFLILGFKKVAWFLFPSFHRENIYAVYGFSPKIASIIGVICGLSSATLILFGIIGFVLNKQDLYWKITLWLSLLSLVVTFIAYGSPRYRDQIDNLIIVFMANIITRWKEVWCDIKNLKNEYCGIKVYLIVMIVLLLMVNWIFVLNKK